jgi:hypothetical protein
VVPFWFDYEIIVVIIQMMNKNDKKEKEQQPKIVIPKGRVLYEVGGT